MEKVNINNRTKGEWVVYPPEAHRNEYGKFSCFVRKRIGQLSHTIISNCFGKTASEAEANAAYIVKACNNYDALVNKLTELMRFESLFNHVAPELQYPDNFLKAVEEAKQLLNSIKQ